jgi:hypothetical protein
VAAQNYDVGDLGLADVGLKRIDWALSEMPVVAGLIEELAATKPLESQRSCEEVGRSANPVRSPTTSPRLPAPIDPEALAMPPHQGLRMDDVDRLCRLRLHPTEPCDDETVHLRQTGAL